VVRGQYAAGWVGGRQVRAIDEPEVAEDSETDTVALRLEARTALADVPFYVRTGKRLQNGHRNRDPVQTAAADAFRGATTDQEANCSRCASPTRASCCFAAQGPSLT
jgi:hypothetical protein